MVTFTDDLLPNIDQEANAKLNQERPFCIFDVLRECLIFTSDLFHMNQIWKKKWKKNEKS